MLQEVGRPLEGEGAVAVLEVDRPSIEKSTMSTMIHNDHDEPSTNLNGPDDPSESAVMHPLLSEQPTMAVSGRGCWITTSDGQDVFDGSCGAAVACLGHSEPRVKAAMMRQLDAIAFCYSPFFTTDTAENLATELTESTGNRMSKAFIVSSGTEAVESALKMARHYFLELPQKQPQRVHFIGRRQSWHGNTLGSLAVGNHPVRKGEYIPLLPTNVSHVSPCYPYRDQNPKESDEAYVLRLARELEDEFQAVGPNKVCAFVAETVSGTTLGSVPPTAGYFKAIRQVCDRHGALLILDEVMSGMGRTGTTHAWEQEDIVPDLQAVAKGLGGGYAPIGALLVSDKIVSTLAHGHGASIHNQTYQCHPVACAAAREVQRIIREDNLMANVQTMGDHLGTLLKERLGSHKNVGDIRGRGLFWGIEFVANKATKQPFPASRKIATVIHKAGISKHGISCIPGHGCADGTDGDIIQISPPYIISRDEVELMVVKIAATVEDVLGR